ncbi:MAG: hypothetical protein ACWA5X_12995 [bacterium]
MKHILTALLYLIALLLGAWIGWRTESLDAAILSTGALLLFVHLILRLGLLNVILMALGIDFFSGGS